MDETSRPTGVATTETREATVRNGTAISLVVLLLVILGAMALQLSQAR